jgi:hypothetical protein
MSTDDALVVKSKLPIRLTLRQATGEVLFRVKGGVHVGHRQLLFINPREQQGVVVDDGVGD